MAPTDTTPEPSGDGMHSSTTAADESYAKHMPRHHALQAQITNETRSRKPQLPQHDGLASAKLGIAMRMQMKPVRITPEALS